MKKVLFAVFFTIILCAANLFAQEIETWSVAFDDSAAYEAGRSLAFAPKKIIYIMLYIGMFISALLALLKKISLSWFLGLLSWTAIFITAGMIEDFVDKEEYLFNNLLEVLLCFIVFVTVALLPIFIPLLQYKFKKIDKKTAKTSFACLGCLRFVTWTLYRDFSCFYLSIKYQNSIPKVR